MVTVPVTLTKAYGGRSSSTHSAAMPVRATARPLIECAPVLKTKSSPSSTNQIGTTWGRPSWRVVASLPVRVPSLTKARHSASSMRRGIGRP